MEFVESAIFTRLIVAIMGDTAYAALQEALRQHPDDGDLTKTQIRILRQLIRE